MNYNAGNTRISSVFYVISVSKYFQDLHDIQQNVKIIFVIINGEMNGEIL